MIGARCWASTRARHSPAIGSDDIMDPMPIALAVTPALVSISVLGTAQLQVMQLKSDGSQTDVTGQVAWGSSDVLKATVSVLGLVAGVALGTSTVTATLGGMQAQSVITVSL